MSILNSLNDSTKSKNEANGELMYNSSGTTLHQIAVAGIGLETALIDSGSNLCVTRRNVLTDKMASKIRPAEARVRIKTGDGSKIKCFGLVKLSVSYLDETVELDFFVVSELVVPILLGTSWIEKSGAILQSDGFMLRVDFRKKKEKMGCRTKYDCLHGLPYVFVDVNGVRKVKALVDTGCARSIVLRDLLTELQELNSIATLNIISAKPNGEKFKNLIGYVRLNVAYQGITTFIDNANVSTKMKFPLILGMDWIHKTRITIQCNDY